MTLVVFAYYHCLHQEDKDLATWKMFTEVHSENPSFQEEAIEFVIQQVRPLTEVFDIESRTLNQVKSIQEHLDKRFIGTCNFADKYQFEGQFHIFHQHTGIYLSSFPSTFLPEKRQLFFLGTGGGDTIEITAVITNISSFFAAFGIFCGFCKKQFRGKGTQHKCPLAITCFVCRRPFFLPNYYCNKQLKKYFCTSNSQASVAEECENCQLSFFSEDCAKIHKQKVCRWGYFCKSCQKYTYQSNFISTKDIKKNHVCGQKACYFCGETDLISSNFHLCSLQLPKADLSYTKLGFLDVQVSGSSPAMCKDCYLLGKPCKFCTDNLKSDPMLCTLLLETEWGTFDSYSFIGKKIFRKEKAIFFEYLPQDIKVPLQSQGYCTRFGKRQKLTHCPQTFTSSSVLDSLFLFLSQKQREHLTILINDDDHNIMALITKVLRNKGFTPQIVGSPTILCINVASLNLRFINSENYLDLTFKEQVKTLGLPPFYFPLRWRKESNLKKTLEAPCLSDYFEFNDGIEDELAKKAFCSQLTGPFNFIKNLTLFSFFKAKTTCLSALHFLKHSFLCQVKLKESLKREEFLIPPVHPFNAPLCTRAGYSYKLLCLFSKNINSLRVVKGPIYMQSSIGELQFCSYILWKNSPSVGQFAWSSLGQKVFAEAVPDLLLNKVCYFYNGCFVHGHDKSKCLFKRKTTKRQRNMFGEDLEEAQKNYERKKARLLTYHPELQVKEMWHCQWQKQKKTNAEVKFFIKHVYKNPPIYRLNARAAGKCFNLVNTGI